MKKLHYLTLILLFSSVTFFYSCNKDDIDKDINTGNNNANTEKPTVDNLIPAEFRSSKGDTVSFVYKGNTNILLEIRHSGNKSRLLPLKFNYKEDNTGLLSVSRGTDTLHLDISNTQISAGVNAIYNEFVVTGSPYNSTTRVKSQMVGTGMPGQWQSRGYEYISPTILEASYGNYYGTTTAVYTMDGKNGIFKNILGKTILAFIETWSTKWTFCSMLSSSWPAPLFYSENNTLESDGSVFMTANKYNEFDYPIEYVTNNKLTWEVDYISSVRMDMDLIK